MFPELEKDKNNIVKLTYREHYLCHLLLAKIYPCDEMRSAFVLMSGYSRFKRTSSHLYEKMRKEWSYVNSIINIGNTYHLGHKHTEESKQKMSEAKKGKASWNKGIPMREESRQKMINALKGHTAWNKGIPASEEAKKKMSEAKKGKPGPWAGKKLSEEHKKKVGEKSKGRSVGRTFWNNGVDLKFVRECPRRRVG